MKPEELSTVTMANGYITWDPGKVRTEITHPHVLDVRLVDGKIEVLRSVEVQDGWHCTIEFRQEWQKGGSHEPHA